MQIFRIPSPKEGKPTPVGFTIMRALKDKLKEMKQSAENVDSIQLITDTEVIGLVTWNDYITGVRTLHNGTKGF